MSGVAPKGSLFYRANQASARALARLVGDPLEVVGLEHVPRIEPFILVANHQSFLDPIFLQGFCPRPLHAMAKSTQFASAILGPWMKGLNAYPVRRFRVDPQAVRVTLRKLRQGHAISIYVEGERTWDGALGRPRLGALRVLLKAGVPVVPAAVEGNFDVMPRWAKGLRRHPLRLVFGPPLRLPQLDDRAAREAALPETERIVMAAIRGLMRDPPPLLDRPIGSGAGRTPGRSVDSGA